jgi:hypothetical protein
MSYTTKTVDGVPVDLTPQEIADLEARDAAWVAGTSARQARVTRRAELTGDPTVIDWSDRIANATAAQIDTYFANNVTNAASAIAVLKAIVKLLAQRL